MIQLKEENLAEILASIKYLGSIKTKKPPYLRGFPYLLSKYFQIKQDLGYPILGLDESNLGF